MVEAAVSFFQFAITVLAAVSTNGHGFILAWGGMGRRFSRVELVCPLGSVDPDFQHTYVLSDEVFG